MPRLSNLQILKNNTTKDLNIIRNRLDPRTFRAYERKILNAGKAQANKLASEIRLIKSKPIQEAKLTAKKIKEKKSPFLYILFSFGRCI